MSIDILWMVLASAVATALIVTGIYIIAEKVIEYVSKKRSGEK